MVTNMSFAHLRIKELEGRILARRRLAEQAPERTWHLDYVEKYEAEVRQLQSTLQQKGTALVAHRHLPPHS